MHCSRDAIQDSNMRKTINKTNESELNCPTLFFLNFGAKATVAPSHDDFYRCYFAKVTYPAAYGFSSASNHENNNKDFIIIKIIS